MIELFRQSFVQNAFLAGTVIAVITGVVGYFVVLRAQAFAAESLSCIGFAGATGAALLGTSSLLGMVGFTVLAALGMGVLEGRLKGRDVEIGMVLSFALGLGVLFLRLYTRGATEAVGVLFGSILSVTKADVRLTLVFSGIILAVLSFLFRPLLFMSIDPEVAEARAVPVKLLGIIFMLILAVTVAESIQVIGVLLVFALLVAPAATAQHLTKRPLYGILFSVILGLAFTWGGLLLALVTRFPISFYIASLAGLTYFITVGVVHKFIPHKLPEITHHHT